MLDGTAKKLFEHRGKLACDPLFLSPAKQPFASAVNTTFQSNQCSIFDELGSMIYFYCINFLLESSQNLRLIMLSKMIYLQSVLLFLCVQNDEEMPDVSVLSQAQQHPQSLAIREKTLNLRELSKDSGIHELMEEEKRKSARRKEYVFVLFPPVETINYR